MDMTNCTVPYFGFKAKHVQLDMTAFDYCTVPYFGFKAKLSKKAIISRQLLYCALFWIQGKTRE